MLRLCFLSVSTLLLTLSIGRVASQDYVHCVGTCEILFNATCEAMAAEYDFDDECCSLISNKEKSTCTLISTSVCTKISRTYHCESVQGNPDEFVCNWDYYNMYEAIGSTDECPVSEIDVLNRADSAAQMWIDLTMILVGVTELLSEEQITNWETISGNQFVDYYGKPGGNVHDVVGYVGFNDIYFLAMGGHAYVSYVQQASWRTDDEYFDPTTLVTDSFMSADGAPLYIDALNGIGIPAVNVIVLLPVTDAPMPMPAPQISFSPSPTIDATPLIWPPSFENLASPPIEKPPARGEALNNNRPSVDSPMADKPEYDWGVVPTMSMSYDDWENNYLTGTPISFVRNTINRPTRPRSLWGEE